MKDEILSDMKFQIRETLQVLHLQFGVMEEAIERCTEITDEINYKDCALATGRAKDETRKLLEVSRRLVAQMEDLHHYVIQKNL